MGVRFDFDNHQGHIVLGAHPPGVLGKRLEDSVEDVLKESPDVIIFDMEFTDYISSSGIRVLLKTKKTLKETNGKMVFMNLQPQIKKVFDILNALPTIQVFASIEELDKYLDTMQKASR